MRARTAVAVCILGAATWFPATPVSAGPLAPTKASQIVTAFASSVPDAVQPCFEGASADVYRVTSIGNPDGTGRPFAIPSKHVFVVTSFDYQVFGTGTSRNILISVLAVDPANPPTSIIGYPAFAITGAATDSGGSAFGNAQIPSGLVIKPPAVPCVGIPGDPALVVLHGFFAKDK